MAFRRQLPSPEHSRGSGGSGEPIEALGKLQDRFPRAGIVQLPATSRACSARSSHSQASFNIDGIFVLPPVVSCRGISPCQSCVCATKARPRPIRRPPATARPKADGQKQHDDERCSWGESRDRVECRCAWVKSLRMTAAGNSRMVHWWHYFVVHERVLSALLSANKFLGLMLCGNHV